MNFENWTPEYFIENEEECKKYFSDEIAWQNVPILNHSKLQDLQDNTLVRFRGMVSDMANPEFYLSSYLVNTQNGTRTQNGKFRDTLVLNENETLEPNCGIHDSRRTLFIISVPGINSWVDEIEQRSCQNQKFEIETRSNSSTKRSLEIEDMAVGESDPNSSKKLSNEKSKNGKLDNLQSNSYLLNSPISSRPSQVCMVKIYEKFDDYILNSVVDVIGFLSVNPALDPSLDELSDSEDIEEILQYNPSPSLVPRLHAVFIKKMDHFNPLLDRSVYDNSEIDIDNSMEMYKNINLALTQCLFGDKIAAEYLFCYLISTVYIRNEIMPLGKFTLNISNIPFEVLPDYTKLLYEILEFILPASHYFSMTLENLNDTQFFPKPDPTTNKLHCGLLQLAPKTHLIIDETKLNEGKLESTGIEGIKNISHLINTQKIICNFKFFEMEYEVDIPVLILSEGKSMLPKDYHIPLKIEPETIPLIKENLIAAKFFLQTKANSIRTFLTKMKLQEFNMNPTDPEMVQNDFVIMRRERKATAADLHSLLVLSRLIGLSKGELCLNKTVWERAKFIEDERRSRIK